MATQESTYTSEEDRQVTYCVSDLLPFLEICRFRGGEVALYVPDGYRMR
jgi:hypothetical protein